MKGTSGGDRVAAGCITLLMAWVILALVPSVLLMLYAEPHGELSATAETSTVYQAVRVAGRDLAWVKAEAVWPEDGAPPAVTLTSRSMPWAGAEGTIVKPDTPYGTPVLQWELRTGLLGVAERHTGSTPLPRPTPRPSEPTP